MDYPTMEQYIAVQQGTGRKAAKSKWWQVGTKKVAPEEKRRRRFEGDTRPYSERNAHHRKTANFLSYFFQLVSISGAVYGSYRMFWDQSFMGGVLLGIALVVLYHYEKLARWTSDKFWDERAAGRYDLKFAALNFGVIWQVGLALTIGGAYFFLNDYQPAAEGSISSSDPAFVKMEKRVADARGDVKNAERRVAEFKKDRSNLCKDSGKWVVCYNRRKALSRLTGTIETAENRLSEATGLMASRFGSLKILDDRATAYHLTVVDSRFYAQIGIFFLCLILFEVCMWYRSKYDMMLFWEEEYARAYGRKPKGETKMSKAKKKKGAKKLSPRPSKAGVTPDASPVLEPKTTRNGSVTDNREPVMGDSKPVIVNGYAAPVEVPEGYKMCALDRCTNLVSGKKKFCSESHRVSSYKVGRVAT